MAQEIHNNDQASTLSQGLLLAGQRAWIADDSPLKVCEKGRRTGLTWAEAADDVLIAASSTKAGGSNVYYFPQSKEDAVEYIETCGKWCKAFGKAAGEIVEYTWEEELGMVLPEGDPDKYIKSYRIEFASGNRIVALSSSPARARGKQGVFVIDEAAFHPHLPGVIKAVMATFLRGGRVRVISTHDGEDNPFNELLTEIRSGRRKGSVHRYTFRQAVSEGMYKRICEVQGEKWTQEKQDKYVADSYAYYGEDASEELDAVPKAGSGTFLPGVLIEERMSDDIPVLRLEYSDAFTMRPEHERRSECQAWIDDYLQPLIEKLPQGQEHYLGEDFGRSGHLSVLAPYTLTPTLKRRTPFTVELRNVPFQQQEQILFHICDRLPKFRAAALDARGNGQYLAERAAQRYGAGRVDQVMLTVDWYRDNMPKFKAAFEDDMIEIPADADTRADLRAIKMRRGVAQVPDNAETTGTDGKKRHADSAIALALGYHATNMDVTEIGYIEVPKRRGRWDGPADVEWHDHASEAATDYVDDMKGGAW